ncbi:MAG: hypothetical protein ACFFD4_38460 [Candidatus Odinarchaeota archaeon]
MTAVTDQPSSETVKASFVLDLTLALSKLTLVLILFSVYGNTPDFLIGLLLVFLAAFILFSGVGDLSKIITYTNASWKYKKPYMRTSVTCPFLQVSFLNLRCKASLREPYEWEEMEKCHLEQRWRFCWTTKAPYLLEVLNSEFSPIEVQAQAALYLGIMENSEAFPRVIEIIEKLQEQNTAFRRILLSSIGHLMRSTDDSELLRRGAAILVSNQGNYGRFIDITVTEACVLAGKSLIQPFKELLSIPLDRTYEERPEGEMELEAPLVNLAQKTFIIRILYSLAGNYPEEVFNALVDQENLESDLIRSFRAKTLATTRKTESIPILIDLLLDEDTLVVAEARKSLRSFGILSLGALVDVLFDEKTSDDLFDEASAAIETFELKTVTSYLQSLRESDEQKFHDTLELARNNDIKVFLLDSTAE